MKRKVLAGLLSFAMVFSLMPSTAVFAEEDVNNTSQIETQADGQEEAPTETQTDNQEATQQEETKTSDSVTSLQNRIASLPSVEEFQSAEKSKQDEIYKEAQDISDEYDKLSKEEQGQVDTSKLEALFEYFNSMTEETATTITPSSVGSNNYAISSGGTYTLSGGTYSSSIIIDTTAAVTLNIAENITAAGSEGAFISVQSACSNLTINGNGYTISKTNGKNILDSRTVANITVTGGTFTGNTASPAFGNLYGGTLTFRNVTVNNACVNNSNANSTVNIEEGTVFNCSSSLPYGIFNGIIRVKGGTINGNGNLKPIRSKNSYDDIEITGGSITGGTYGVYIESGSSGNVKIGGSAVLNNNTADVYLYTGKTFVVNENYQGKVKVALSTYPSSNVKQQITKSQSTDYQKDLNVVSADSSYSVDYDTSGKYLYMWKHAHTWSYSASGNTVTATCSVTSNPCSYHIDGLTLTLTAPNTTYSGKAYTGASVTNNITSVTGASAGSIKYAGRAGTTYAESTTAPTNAGKYTASVTIGGKTATADFEITKKQIDKPDADGTHYVYNGNNQFYKIPASGWYSVNGNSRTDAGTQTVTVKLLDKTNSEWSDGKTDDLTFTFTIAKADTKLSAEPAARELIYEGHSQNLINAASATGGKVYYRLDGTEEWSEKVPVAKNAGSYKVFYYVKATDAENYNDAGSKDNPLGSVEINVAKRKLTADMVTVSDDQKYTGEAISPTVTVSDKVNDIDIIGSADYTVSGNGAQTKVGPYDITVSATEKGNYTGSVKKTWNIVNNNFAEGSIQAKGYEGVYDGKEHSISVTAPKGATITYSETENGEYTEKAPSYKDVTETTVYYHVEKDGYETAKGSAVVKITPKTIGLTWGDHEFTYNGKVQAPKASATDLIDGDSCDITVSEGSVNYTEKPLCVTATGVSNPNYQLPTAGLEQEYTIAKKTVGIEWGNTELTYTGEEQAPTATATGLVDGDTCEIEVSGAAADYGTHTAIAVGISNSNYQLPANATTTFTIDKAVAEVQAPEAIPGLIYNGENQTLIAAGNTADGTLKYKVNGGDWTTELPTGLNAGTYEVSYKVFGDENHKDSKESTVTVTIAKKAVTVSGITAEDKTYDGKTETVLNYTGAAFDGLLEKDSLSVTAKGAFTDKNAGAEKKVQISVLTLGGTSVGNYELAGEGQQTETTAQITAKDITAAITPNGGIFEGTITPATAVLNGLVKGDDPEVTLTYTGTANDRTVVNGTKAPTHAGNYTVTASITDSNYNLLKDGATAEYVVAKAAPALSVSAIADKNYGDNAFELEVSHKGDGVKSYASNNEKVAKVDKDGKVSIIGAGKATLTVSLAESANYTADQKEVIITVKKVNHELVVKELAYNVTYGDPAFKIAAKAGDNEAAIKFTSKNKDVASVSEDGTVTVGNAGTAKIMVSMDESNDYLAVSEEVTVNVASKAVTVTANNASKVYGDKDDAFTYTSDGLVGKDTLSGITLTREEGETVGTYDITASEKKNANPNYEVTFNKGIFTITEKEIGLKWSDTELTYNGKAQKPAATATGLVGKDTCDVTVSGAQKDVGTYTATVVKLSNKNYKLPEQVTTEFVIGAKEIGIKWSDIEFTYDGTEKLPTATATGLVDGDTCEIEVSGAATDAGTHTVKAEKVNNNNYKLPKDVETTYVINKADAVYEAPEVKTDLVYNGAEQSLITAGTTKDGTLMYKVGDGEWSTEIPAGLNAGDYTVSYKVVGDDNHNDSEEGTLTISIAKKAVTVSGITAEDKTYDGNAEVVLNYTGAAFDGLLEKDSLSITAKGMFADKNAGADKKVQISGLTLSGASAGNYELAGEGQQTETTAQITAKNITAAITPNGGTYEGTITPATAVLNDLVKGDDPEITLTYVGTANDGTVVSGTEVPTHAGIYTVTASITDSNYNLLKDGATAEYVVAKAAPQLSVSAVSDKNYGDEAFKLEVSHKGDGKKSYTSSNEKVAKVDKDGKVSIVGAGKATLTVSLAESANYTADQTEVTVTVKKVNHELIVKNLTYNVTYGDSAFKIAAETGDHETAIKFTSKNPDVASVSEDGTVTVGNAGTAKITISMDESDDYLAVAREVTVNVAPKAVTVTANDTEKHINKADPNLNAIVSGVVGKDQLKGITVSRKAGEAAGTYEINVTVDAAANPNYDITTVSGTFTINDHDWSGEWKTVKEAIATENGKREKSCAYDGCEQKLYESIPATGTPEEPGNPAEGTLRKDAEVAPDAPISEATLDNAKSELIKADGIFTEAEKEAISSGSNARVWLEITGVDMDTISKGDQAAMEAAAKEIMGENLNLTYFNADLFKQVDGTAKSQIHDPGTMIKVTIQIPEELLNHDKNIAREYKILRLHDGKVDVISGTFNADTNEFTFETDRFSTYAIAYGDTQLVTGVSLDTTEKTLTKAGETVQLTATVAPENAANKKLHWSSSDPKVATVDENGLVTAVSNGTAVITVTTEDGSYTATCKITVNIPAKPADIKPTDNNTTNKPDAKKDTTSAKAPKTDDPMNAAPWAVVALIAGCVAVITGKKRKQERR